MKFVIDTDQSLPEGITLDMVLYLISLYVKAPITEETRINCSKQKLTYEGSLRYDTFTEVESFLLNGEFRKEGEKKDRYDALAEKLREIYPEGKKEGTAYMWRDSVHTIARKLKKLVKKYGDCFSDEDAIEATKRYVESFNGNYMYMQLLKYFILKRVCVGGEFEENSQLLSYIENKGQVNVNNDWVNEML